MVTFENVLETVNKDEGFMKLVQNTTGQESLMSLGFDSLDVLMLSFTVGEKYGIELEIKNHHTLYEIVDLVNVSISGHEA